MSDVLMNSNSRCEEDEGSPFFEMVGDAVAQLDGVSGTGGLGFKLDHGFAVGGDDLGVHGEALAGRDAKSTDREFAASTEGVEKGALGGDAEARVGVFEEGDGLADVGGSIVVRTADFEGEGSLAGGGAHLCRVEALVDPLGAAKAVEAGGGEDEGVAFPVSQLLQACVNVAADFNEGEVGAEGEDLGAAARACGTDAGVVGKRVEGPELLADEDVAGVGAFRGGGNVELGSELGGEVFKGVNGEVDAAVFQGFFDLLDEDALAVEAGGWDKAGLLHPVAGSADDLDLGLVARVA